MIRTLIAALMVVLFASPQAPQPGAGTRSSGTIAVNADQPGHAIPSNLYGIFFEEISHAGEGGLYAELLQNRGFEDSRLPPMCKLENGFVVPPRTPHFDTGKPNDWRLRWNVTSETPAWTLDAAGATASMRLTDVTPLTEATPHSLLIEVKDVAPGRAVSLRNEGFWGINVQQDAQYKLSLYARAEDGFKGPLTARLEGADGRELASAPIVGELAAGWKKFEVTLTAKSSDPKARFALHLGSSGTLGLDFVSLFPAKTWRDRPNGLRPDLAQIVAELKPGFVRWPGGCFAEGINVDSRPQWKRSIGRLEDRTGTYSPWGYWSSDGFGYYEFLQFSEDLGADALFVVNVGVSCSMRSGTYPGRRRPAGSDRGCARRDRIRHWPGVVEVGRRAREARPPCAVPAEIHRDRQRAAWRAIRPARREVLQGDQGKVSADEDRAELMDCRRRSAHHRCGGQDRYRRRARLQGAELGDRELRQLCRLQARRAGISTSASSRPTPVSAAATARHAQ